MYKELKENLLSNKITIKEFVDKLIEIDQSTEDRENCIPNLEFLSDSKIINFINNSDIDTKVRFNQLLSLTELHIAQNIALGDKEFDVKDVLDHFKKAVEYEINGRAFKNNLFYKKATIAYFENNLPELISQTEEYEKLEGKDDVNSIILRNLIAGLQERGSTDYKYDYLKEYNKTHNI